MAIIIQALVEVIWDNIKHFTAYSPGYFGHKCGILLRNIHMDVPIVPPTTCGATKRVNYISIGQ